MSRVTALVHRDEALDLQNEAMALLFRQRVACLSSIKLLCQLSQTVQQHRAATMGFLSGEQAFLELIETLQGNVSRVLAVLQLNNDGVQPVIAADVLANVLGDWKTITVGWRDDHIINNYEFHCHLVAEINKILRSCMKQYLLPALLRGQHQQLLETLLVRLPDYIEQLGMLRALSINAAVVKGCGSDSHKRLSFLLREIEANTAGLMAALIEISPNYQEIPSIVTVKENQKGLQKFLLSVQMNILDCSSITTDSAGLYKLSTHIINIHWLAVEQGIQLVEKLVYTGLIRSVEPQLGE